MVANIDKYGKRIIDIAGLVDAFQAEEGEIQQIIGKTGNGKTYEGTRRAIWYLERGYTVYTTWQLILPDFYDERQDKLKLFWRTITFRKRFYKFTLKDNWHFLDIDRKDLIEFVASLTDCIVLMDEGQDIFDSRGGSDRPARKALTRTRHMRKTLIIISQRAQAVEVTARANVTFFFKCVKRKAFYWPFKPYFIIYRTEEMDQNNYPIWEDLMTGWKAEVWSRHFASKRIYNSYNSWYLRAGIPNSQELAFEAYNLTIIEKIILLILPRKKVKRVEMSEDMKKELEIRNKQKYAESTTYIAPTPKKRSIKAVEKPKELSTGYPQDTGNVKVDVKHT